MDNNSKRILSLTLLLCLFFMLFYGLFQSADAENTSNINNAVNAAKEIITIEAEENSETILDNFKGINENELIELVKSGKVDTITKNQNILYIVDTDGGEYQIETSQEIEAYLKLHQIAIYGVVINIEQKGNEGEVVKESNNSEKPIGWFWYVLLLALSIGGALGYRIYKDKKESRELITTSGTVESNKKQKDGDAEIPVVKFDDVEGIDELKKDIFRLVNCLKNTEKYKNMGARIPKGVILYGPPGTGKTLIAKAIAGEAEVPFFSAVGSDFIEKYVGVGAQRVRELYKKARKSAPCIVFIDEVDAVASRRGDDNNSEGDQTVNALLAELDGFSSSNGIITICATNRLDLLDSAFKRAGRFDLKLAVGLPDRSSRYKILKIHGKNKKFSDDVDFNIIAGKTIGFSGAELEALLNEGALLAADKDEEYITNEDIDDAFFKIVMQGNKKARSEITRIQYITAYHEAGHTLATKLLTNDSVPSVTIVQSSSGAGGVTFRAPPEEGLKSREYLKSLIKVMYAGRAAEEIYLGDSESITTGASNDIKQATEVIKEYLAIYGMGNFGMLDITQFSHDFKDILQEASELAKELYKETLSFLKENKNKLDNLAISLVDKETLNEDEINEILL